MTRHSPAEVSMGSPYKRKKLWVDRLQGRLMVRMAVYLTLYAVVVLHIGFFIQLISQLVQNGMKSSVQDLYLDFLSRQLYIVYALVFIAPCIVLDMLKFSNRIAGPLHRCRRVMQEMAAGRGVPPFEARKHDLMPEFWQAFNSLVATWNSQLRNPPAATTGRSAESDRAPALQR